MTRTGFERKESAVIYWSLILVVVAALATFAAHPVTIAGLVVAAFAVPRFGLALVPIYLGLVLLLPEAGGPFPAILSLTDVLFWPLLLHTVLSRGRIGFRSPVLVAAFALAAASATALVVGVAVRDSALRPTFFTTYQQSAHMAAALLAFHAMRERSETTRIFNWMTIGGCLAAVAGLTQVVGGEIVVTLQQRISETLGYPAYAYGHVERYLWWGMRKAYAGFYSPNALGGALVFCLLLCAGRQLREPSSRVLGAAILIGLGLVATFSRGAILAAVVTLTFLAWRSLRDGRTVAGTALASSALLIPALYGVVVYGSTRTAPVGEVIGGGGGIEVAAPLKRRSAEMKLDEMRNLFSMWDKGIGFFGAGYGVLYESDQGFVHEPHRVAVSPAFAEIIYRSGIVGFLALGIAAFSLGRIWRAQGPMGPNGNPIQPAIFAALVHSAIDHPFLTVPGLVAIFWASWGILEASQD